MKLKSQPNLHLLILVLFKISSTIPESIKTSSTEYIKNNQNQRYNYDDEAETIRSISTYENDINLLNINYEKKLKKQQSLYGITDFSHIRRSSKSKSENYEIKNKNKNDKDDKLHKLIKVKSYLIKTENLEQKKVNQQLQNEDSNHNVYYDVDNSQTDVMKFFTKSKLLCSLLKETQDKKLIKSNLEEMEHKNTIDNSKYYSLSQKEKLLTIESTTGIEKISKNNFGFGSLKKEIGLSKLTRETKQHPNITTAAETKSSGKKRLNLMLNLFNKKSKPDLTIQTPYETTTTIHPGIHTNIQTISTLYKTDENKTIKLKNCKGIASTEKQYISNTEGSLKGKNTGKQNSQGKENVSNIVTSSVTSNNTNNSKKYYKVSKEKLPQRKSEENSFKGKIVKAENESIIYITTDKKQYFGDNDDNSVKNKSKYLKKKNAFCLDVIYYSCSLDFHNTASVPLHFQTSVTAGYVDDNKKQKTFNVISDGRKIFKDVTFSNESQKIVKLFNYGVNENKESYKKNYPNVTIKLYKMVSSLDHDVKNIIRANVNRSHLQCKPLKIIKTTAKKVNDENNIVGNVIKTDIVATTKKDYSISSITALKKVTKHKINQKPKYTVKSKLKSSTKNNDIKGSLTKEVPFKNSSTENVIKSKTEGNIVSKSTTNESITFTNKLSIKSSSRKNTFKLKIPVESTTNMKDLSEEKTSKKGTTSRKKTFKLKTPVENSTNTKGKKKFPNGNKNEGKNSTWKPENISIKCTKNTKSFIKVTNDKQKSIKTNKTKKTEKLTTANTENVLKEKSTTEINQIKTIKTKQEAITMDVNFDKTPCDKIIITNISDAETQLIHNSNHNYTTSNFTFIAASTLKIALNSTLFQDFIKKTPTSSINNESESSEDSTEIISTLIKENNMKEVINNEQNTKDNLIFNKDTIKISSPTTSMTIKTSDTQTVSTNNKDEQISTYTQSKLDTAEVLFNKSTTVQNNYNVENKMTFTENLHASTSKSTKSLSTANNDYDDDEDSDAEEGTLSVFNLIHETENKNSELSKKNLNTTLEKNSNDEISNKKFVNLSQISLNNSNDTHKRNKNEYEITDINLIETLISVTRNTITSFSWKQDEKIFFTAINYNESDLEQTNFKECIPSEMYYPTSTHMEDIFTTSNKSQKEDSFIKHKKNESIAAKTENKEKEFSSEDLLTTSFNKNDSKVNEIISEYSFKKKISNNDTNEIEKCENKVTIKQFGRVLLQMFTEKPSIRTEIQNVEINEILCTANPISNIANLTFNFSDPINKSNSKMPIIKHPTTINILDTSSIEKNESTTTRHVLPCTTLKSHEITSSLKTKKVTVSNYLRTDKKISHFFVIDSTASQKNEINTEETPLVTETVNYIITTDFEDGISTLHPMTSRTEAVSSIYNSNKNYEINKIMSTGFTTESPAMQNFINTTYLKENNTSLIEATVSNSDLRIANEYTTTDNIYNVTEIPLNTFIVISINNHSPSYTQNYTFPNKHIYSLSNETSLISVENQSISSTDSSTSNIISSVSNSNSETDNNLSFSTNITTAAVGNISPEIQTNQISPSYLSGRHTKKLQIQDSIQVNTTLSEEEVKDIYCHCKSSECYFTTQSCFNLLSRKTTTTPMVTEEDLPCECVENDNQTVNDTINSTSENSKVSLSVKDDLKINATNKTSDENKKINFAQSLSLFKSNNNRNIYFNAVSTKLQTENTIAIAEEGISVYCGCNNTEEEYSSTDSYYEIATITPVPVDTKDVLSVFTTTDQMIKGMNSTFWNDKNLLHREYDNYKKKVSTDTFFDENKSINLVRDKNLIKKSYTGNINVVSTKEQAETSSKSIYHAVDEFCTDEESENIRKYSNIITSQINNCIKNV
ncbi:uncharacterized protein LOC142324223 [Lycorma delicatula]|uniref:uncharacterized protein LOC142324223 n=1 Tax=Lycorma delicatula TaxID=130591 RepID=UPI003F51275A